MKKLRIINSKQWKTIMNFDLPSINIMPMKQTKHEKLMAKFMQKVVDYEYAQIKKSKIMKLPFGTLIWTPK
jgi:hypothetical protein